MEEKALFVEKASNPQNVPQARPIGNFCGILRQKVYERGWQARTIDSNLMSSVKRKSGVITDSELLDTCKK